MVRLPILAKLFQRRAVFPQRLEQLSVWFVSEYEDGARYGCCIVGKTASLVWGAEEHDAKGAVVDLFVWRLLLCYNKCLSTYFRTT